MKEGFAKRYRYGFLYPRLGALPRGFAYGLAYRYGSLLGLTDPSDRAMMSQNLRAVLGADADTDGIIREHLAMRALENLDPYYLDDIDVRFPLSDFMEFRNLEVLKEAHARGRGVILLIGHYGRVTMPFVGLGHLGYRVGGITMEIQKNPYLGACERLHIQRKSDRIERHAGGVFARVGNVPQLRGLYQLLKENGLAYLAVDVFSGGDQGVVLPFLNGRARFPDGILRLAHKNRSAVVGCFAFQEGVRLVVEFEPAPEPSGPDDHKCLERYVRILEGKVIARPQEYWFWPALHHIWEHE